MSGLEATPSAEAVAQSPKAVEAVAASGQHQENGSATRRSHTRLVIIFGVVSVLLIAVGFAVERAAELAALEAEASGALQVSKLTGHLITEIGIAGLVAVFLVFTIEGFNAREFEALAKKVIGDYTRDFEDLAKRVTNEIKQDVFNSVFGFTTPPEIKELIYKQILQIPFVRRELNVTYALTPLEDATSGGKYLLVEREVSYVLENLTDMPQHFNFEASIDMAPLPHLEGHVKFLGLDIEGSQLPVSYGEQELAGWQTDEGHERYLRIPLPIVVLNNQRTKITFQSQTVVYLEGGNAYFILFNPSCDLTLMVLVPERNLEVRADSFAPGKLLPAKDSIPKHGIYTWKAQHPLLAYQGFCIWWKPKALGGNGASASSVTTEQPAPVVVEGDAFGQSFRDGETPTSATPNGSGVDAAS